MPKARCTIPKEVIKFLFAPFLKMGLILMVPREVMAWSMRAGHVEQNSMGSGRRKGHPSS